MSKFIGLVLLGLFIGSYATTYVETIGSGDRVWEIEYDADSVEDAKALAEAESIEKLMAQDDLGQMMLQLEDVLERRETSITRRGGMMSGADSEALDALRKFKSLKSMVMFLQPSNITIFGRYCYYGCWCLPNGQHNLASGYGFPVDPIDEVCKEFALCYKCIEIDFAGTCDANVGYKWKKIYTSGVHTDIDCRNDPNIGANHRCSRYVCECDRILAVGLATYWMFWNISLHARWGSFSRATECFPNNGQYRQDDCCGCYGTASAPDTWNCPTRRPYSTLNPATGCCQDFFMYDTTNKQCCFDDEGAAAGDFTITPDIVRITNTGEACRDTDGPDDKQGPDLPNDFNGFNHPILNAP